MYNILMIDGDISYVFKCFKNNVNVLILQICKVINNEVMKCPTPPLVDSLKNIIRSRRSTPGSMSYLVQEENAHASSTVQHVQVSGK